MGKIQFSYFNLNLSNKEVKLNRLLRQWFVSELRQCEKLCNNCMFIKKRKVKKIKRLRNSSLVYDGGFKV